MKAASSSGRFFSKSIESDMLSLHNALKYNPSSTTADSDDEDN